MEECMPPEGEELFTNNCGLPIQFSIPICPEKEEYRRKIEGHGGSLTSIKGGHHTIHIVPPTLKTTSSTSIYDVFSTRYIDDCIHGEKLLSLESYRIGKSQYSSDISVNDIMMGIRSWKDCTVARNNIGEDVVFNDDDDGMLPLPPRTKWKGRRDYDHREKRAILNYIIDNKKYHEVKGRSMWIEMERAKVCPGRTWESMKEHFRKNIIHNLHIFKLDDKTLRRLTEPFVKERITVKRRCPSDDSDDEVSSNGDEDNVSSKDVRNLDRDKKGNGQKELNAKIFNRAVDGKISKEDNSNDLTVQETSSNSNPSLAPDGGNKKQNEQGPSNRITTVERTSQGIYEENAPPKMLKLADNSEVKSGESDLSNSSDSTIMSDEELGNDGKLDGGATGDKSEDQNAVNITVTIEVCENDQNDSSQSKNFVPTSSGQSLPDVISSNSASVNTESTHEKSFSHVATSDSGNINTQTFDIAYSNEEFSTNHSGLHLPNRKNKDHEKCNLRGHKNSGNIDEDHHVHKNKEVTSRCSEGEDISESPSRGKENVHDSLFSQTQTECAQASQNPVTGDKVISDNLKELDESQISAHHLTRNDSIKSLTTSRSKDANLSPESNVTSNGTFSKQNSRRKQNIRSPRSLRTRDNCVHSPRAGDDTSDVYGSPLSGTQSEGYESCCDQHHKEDTIQKELAQSRLETLHSDSSSRSSSSSHSVASTIIFPLPGNGSRRKQQGSSDTCTDTSRNINEKAGHEMMRRKRRKRLINDSDSDDQREDQSESSDNEVILKRNPHIHIFGNNPKSQKANQREPETDCVSETSSSDMEDHTRFSCASNRNNHSGRYDRTFNPKSGCREGDKRVNGKLGTARKRSNMPYTSSEDVKILKYIIKYKGYDKLGGNVFWKDMEASKTVPGRSWHSLKERYRKRIVHHLPIFLHYGINENHLRRLSSGAGEIDHGSQSKDDSNIRKRPYTRDEDYLILKFISENKRHSQIGGKLMWVLMSESIEGLQGRTWLSLKERFRRTIMKNLGSYKISDEEKRKFKKSEERRAPGIKLYFKEEKTSSSEDESFSSDGCVDDISTVRENSGIDKSTSLSYIKSKKSEDIRRGLESRRVIDKHLGMETKPSTSGYYSKNKPNDLMKRKLYTASLVFDELPKNCRSTQTVEPSIMPNKEMIPETSDDTNENHIKKKNPKLNENSDDSQGGESEEIPLLLGSQSLNSCSISKSLCMNKRTVPVESVISSNSEKVSENNAAVMDESVMVSNSSNFGKESEQETWKKNEVPITADHESQAFGTNSEVAITSDQESEFHLMSDFKSQQPDTLSVKQNVKESNVLSSPSPVGNKYSRTSSTSSGTLKKKRCWENSHINLRSSSVRRKLRKRRIRHFQI
ncbi:serine-rich adhesin for platelets-like isoform X2 [Macrobrachium rosenbergii]|uniref:serine-rich adhesin for platelets-like isoform X2 n=1 Tax=Macrobrachium rosenbergii TaxID=79674 RepID=UPI0034D710E5